MRRTALLLRIRRSLVAEGLREGMSVEQAQTYATKELTEFRYTTSQLRMIAREC
jgi:hypothetical protein